MSALKTHPRVSALIGIALILILLIAGWTLTSPYPNSYLSWGPSIEIEPGSWCPEPKATVEYLGRPELKVYRSFASLIAKEQILNWFRDAGWRIIPRSGFTPPESINQLPISTTSLNIAGIASVQREQLVILTTLKDDTSWLTIMDTFDLCFPWQRTKIELPGY